MKIVEIEQRLKELMEEVEKLKKPPHPPKRHVVFAAIDFELAEHEVYCGLIPPTRGETQGYHLILCGAHPTRVPYHEAWEVARCKGLRIPTLRELAHINVHLSAEFFRGGAYWACDHATGGEAWTYRSATNQSISQLSLERWDTCFVRTIGVINETT